MVAQRRDRIWIYDYMAEFRDFAVPGFLEVENTSTGFIPFMSRVWAESRAGISTLLLLDEIAVYGKNNLQIDHVYRLGRHKGIDIISISQRFHSLPVIVRSQTDIFHVFQVTERRDVDYLRGLVSDEVLKTIMGLNMFEYINISL